jgi:SPP1 family predicted phage head-tail adaptor
MRKPINGFSPKAMWDLGLMREQITLKTVVQSPDSGGGYSENPGTYKTTWTFPESITNEWLLRMGQKSTGDNRIFVVRYDQNITKDMWIVAFDLTYRILKIDDLNKGREFLKLECEGNKNDGR